MSQTFRNAGLLVLLLLLVLGVGVSVAEAQGGGAGITVSDDVNFEGATVTFRNDVPDLRDVRFNDRISSLRVAPGESWEVCEDTNYGGRCLVVTGSEGDLRIRGVNDSITSMRRVQGRDTRRGRDERVNRDERDDRRAAGMTVSDDVNFEGATLTFRSDVPDLRAFQFNDRISSLQVAPGESWEVCENDNYGGRCLVVSGAERDLRARGLNDSITSMRRVQDRDVRGNRDDRDTRDTRDTRGDIATGSRRPREELMLFDQPGYRGATQRVSESAAGLGAFTNRARSVQILDGVWELCEQPQWRGRCVRVSSSVPDLGRIGISGVASARPLDSGR